MSEISIIARGLTEHRSYLILMVIKQGNDSAYRTVLSRPSGRREIRRSLMMSVLLIQGLNFWRPKGRRDWG